MSEVIPTFGKYGVLGVLAAFPVANAFVFGAMAVALGFPEHVITQIVQVLAAIAIVVTIGKREGFLSAVAAGIGLGMGGVASVFVQDAFIAGFSNALGGVLWNVWTLLIHMLGLGVALGLMLGVSGPFTVTFAVLGGVIVGFIQALLARLLSWVEGALEATASVLAKALPIGYLALAAPYLGGLLFGIPLALSVTLFLATIVLGIGLIIGMALASAFIVTIPFAGMALLAYIAGFIMGRLAFRFTIAELGEPLLDLLMLIIFPWAGPALFTAGYAMLLSRKRSKGLYAIGLAALGYTYFFH
mgnify:CR=1 FL=1